MDKEYDALLRTYQRMFSLVDAFHFNSQNTRDVYEQYIDVREKSAVISITHSEVNDHRAIRNYDDAVLRLGFIGSEAPYKGLSLLKAVICRLNDDGFAEKIHLDVYGGRYGRDERLSNVEYKGRFDNNHMAEVYESMDLLVVPSIWNETFGFTTIEALQFGVPVLVSSKVGARDIVNNYAPDFVFHDEFELYTLLRSLINDRIRLVEYNRSIMNGDWNYSMTEHANQIVNKMYKK